LFIICIIKIATKATVDSKYLKIGWIGSRKVIKEGIEGSVSVADLWEAVLKRPSMQKMLKS